MAKADNRPKITLACTECKRRNYNTVKNKVNDRERIADPVETTAVEPDMASNNGEAS